MPDSDSVFTYADGMERIDSAVMDETLAAAAAIDFEAFAAADVRAALAQSERGGGSLAPRDFAALLSPAALPLLEEIAARARAETRRQFGNSVTLFTPLYIANWCENQCVYCGFNCANKIKRAKLSPAEIETEFRSIAATGLQDMLILTGESRAKSPPEYIAEAVALAAKYFSTVGIEVYPMNTDEYARLRDRGADYVCVYQETYSPADYSRVHPAGRKRVFPYRFDAQERALRAGIRGVSFGALLGLADYRRDAFSAGMHARLLHRKFPQSDISFSVPRLRPHIADSAANSRDVHERQLFQVMCAYRLFMPFAGLTISTRERAGFRDSAASICATKISAGVRVGVGGHAEEEKGDGQFNVSDPRSVVEVVGALRANGLQPVYSDYIRVY